MVKAFVHEAIEESLKLERALARLRTPQRLALLHYSPVRGTVEGEPVEIFPYLGCSRFEEPLNRYGVTAVFHGHAHRGTAEARTSAGIPVYNVALPLLAKEHPGRPPLRVLELPGGPDGRGAEAGKVHAAASPSPPEGERAPRPPSRPER